MRAVTWTGSVNRGPGPIALRMCLVKAARWLCGGSMRLGMAEYRPPMWVRPDQRRVVAL
jgi:hypothetical protein